MLFSSMQAQGVLYFIGPYGVRMESINRSSDKMEKLLVSCFKYPVYNLISRMTLVSSFSLLLFCTL